MNQQSAGLEVSGLGAGFLSAALAAPERQALADSAGAVLSYRELAQRALALAGVLEEQLAEAGPRIGVLLPPGEAAALVNLALAMGTRASVNLNALAGPVSLRAQIEQADLKRVITSARIADALGGSATFGSRVLPIEQLLGALRPQPDALEMAAAALARQESRALDAGSRVATVLFSSGSTARPKAIQLTHANVLANARAVAAAFDFGPEDRMFGVLPLFHSFGYTVTLWAPLLAGASVVFHDNPLDARAVGELAAVHRASVLLATPALYQAWMRRVEAAQFSSVRAAVVGAQRLQPALAAAWLERFGSPLFEGYACTELSPVVSANLPARDGQVRARSGSVGRPLSGIEIEIRDPDSGATGFGYRVDPFTKRVAFHSGLDFPTAPGVAVRASANGRVLAAETRGHYGNMIEIDHGRAYRTRYGHLSSLGVQPGEMVQRGQTIGAVGATGRTTGPLLHFEIWLNDVVRDPRKLLDSDPACARR
jgi:acyl-CoA synthetase (AMP-forming)/AMP-acid ligase II